MSKISNISLLIAICFHFNASNNSLANADGPTTDGHKITASGGEDCFKSLDAKDMENLGTILYLRNQTANSINTPHSKTYEEQLKLINETFTGQKRTAAFALLSSNIAKHNDLRLRQAMNQAIFRGDTSLNEAEKKQISDITIKADMDSMDLSLLLNVKTASLRAPAEVLKSKGAKLLPNGEWYFDENFNFSEFFDRPELKEALGAFFPNEVKNLSIDGRDSAIIGNRLVIKTFDPDLVGSGKKTKWYMENVDIKEHTEKMVNLIDKFTKKAEEFARLGKENGHWINLTHASLSNDIFCGMSALDLVNPLNVRAFQNISDFISKKTTGKTSENGYQKWERKLDTQARVHQELFDILNELTLLGANMETKTAIRQAISDLQKKSDVEMAGGMTGMKSALTAICLAPLAVLTAPVSLPSAGSASIVGTTIAYTGVAATIVSLGTPAYFAAKNVYNAIQDGDGALCSLFKHAADLPIKTIDTLKWGAMGPVVKALSPSLQPLAKFLNLGPDAYKYAVIIPGTLISGKGMYDNNKMRMESNKTIANIQKALDLANAQGNKAHATVLEEMLKEAREQKWVNVLSLARSSIGVLGSVNKALAKTAPSISISNLDRTQSVVPDRTPPPLLTPPSSQIQLSGPKTTTSSSSGPNGTTIQYSTGLSSSEASTTISSSNAFNLRQSRTSTSNSIQEKLERTETLNNRTSSDNPTSAQGGDILNMRSTPAVSVPTAQTNAPVVGPTIVNAPAQELAGAKSVDPDSIVKVINNAKAVLNDEKSTQKTVEGLKEKSAVAEKIQKTIEEEEQEALEEVSTPKN